MQDLSKATIFSNLLAFDQEIQTRHPNVTIIGVDEVGRGSLAGPVVAAAIVLPAITSTLATDLTELNDSKLLKASQREQLTLILQEHAMSAIGEATVAEIDSFNILVASLKAMYRAVIKLKKNLPPGKVLLLVDGNKKIPGLNHRQLPIIQGDSRSASIAAASVIAKVYRDKLMKDLAADFPVYDWHNNKGYGVQKHKEAIMLHGLSAWHRRSFSFKA